MNGSDRMDARRFWAGGRKIVVQLVAPQERTAAGIVLPETARERPHVGRVLSVGPAVTFEAQTPGGPRRIEPGAIVTFSKYAGLDFVLVPVERTVDDPEDFVVLISEDDIFCQIGPDGPAAPKPDGRRKEAVRG